MSDIAHTPLVESEREGLRRYAADMDDWAVAVLVESAVWNVERLEAALRSIRDHGQTHDEPCWALHKGDCADAMQEIARAALDASGGS